MAHGRSGLRSQESEVTSQKLRKSSLIAWWRLRYLGCYVETLARFRVDIVFRYRFYMYAEIGEIDGEDEFVSLGRIAAVSTRTIHKPTIHNLDVLLERGTAFRSYLGELKMRSSVADYGWYPYDSLSALDTIAETLSPVFSEISVALAAGPLLDLGCGDGDLGLFLASLGAAVDAIDHKETNYNQLRGVKVLQKATGYSFHVFDVDLNRAFNLPSRNYKCAFFLGTLYHLKNPFLVLEELAKISDWCLLSTRIAQVTPGGTSVEK